MSSVGGTSLARNLPDHWLFSGKCAASSEPGPFRGPLMRHGPARCLANQSRIFGEGAGTMTRRTRLPIVSASSEFLLVDQHIHPPVRCIDPDPVTIAYQRQGTADEGLGRHIADAHSARGAGEPSIRDQGHLLAHALSVDQRGDAEHLAHAWAANRPFIADHKHLARLVVAVVNRCDTSFLVFEDARH